ncbi:M20/M25/M40 family metallo-hydrolase [Nakamurella flavida]|uniref:M20/M25/M40 family metallo-hydrolase n=1 Tax=Nakamurella flavida TaxID=363630 RepID=A0A939C1Z4_9ACTN|nr:M20/M25/M40 family metallo-hydrolase [Nakamurella flavida]MBM9475516.1 M20/M25/M40 family metallo-hydrolase [Nakamurella flavida]MDP9778209.1 acetylornithine deacetylase/succinyl-diaminopimelate desuccinylase-like protein [Nakamurella flavida]
MTDPQTPPPSSPATPSDVTTVRDRVAGLMPGLVADLQTLVGIPSVAFPGFPSEPVDAMAAAVVDLLQRSGADDAHLLEIPGGYPAVYATVPGPPGAPTVLLYAHYDVQPAPPEQGWDTDPWVATTKDDGRIYGRGAADDKSGLVIHAGTLQALLPDPPVNIVLLIEGEEETISHLEEFVEAHPELVQCDAFVIADMGNQEVGRPALTTALRGDVSLTVTVRALDHPVHSGLFGGAVPDALIALIRMLATLHDDAGDTVVPGVSSGEWSGADLDEAQLRDSAGLLDGVSFVGTGTLASRLWAKPSATVIGIDAPTVAHASNVLIPQATAKVSMRVVPGTDPDRDLDALIAHLESVAPWGVQVEIQRVKTGWPFAVDMDGAAVRAAESALVDVFDREVETIGSGGSIPLINTLKQACPRADVILWGAEDTALARIHASNESVDPAEIERMVAAQVVALQRLGATVQE